MLAFTTVALGGFRGLISNALWIRANDLQDEDKFFEMAQLADWITKLEPHFVQVWLVQAWNMAYNISVKFNDSADRWRWVQRGIELLRDEGLRYNPNETLIYRELAWFFQHKMGANLDDAQHVLQAASGPTKWPRSSASKTPQPRRADPPADRRRRPAAPTLLRDKYKMDPRVHEGGGRALRPAGMAPARGARHLLGRLGPGAGREEPDQGQAGRPDHPAPRHLPVHAD